MPIDLNHTIVYVRDKQQSAHWLASIMGFEVSAQYGPFLPVQTSNGVALDFMDAGPGSRSPPNITHSW